MTVIDHTIKTCKFCGKPVQETTIQKTKVVFCSCGWAVGVKFSEAFIQPKEVKA